MTGLSDPKYFKFLYIFELHTAVAVLILFMYSYSTPEKTIDLFLDGKNSFFVRYTGQTNKQQHHFNEWPISELHGEVDSIQTLLKLLFYPPTIMECRLCL